MADRLRSGFESGTITDNPLASGATTINSAAFASLPVVTGGDTLAIILDPEEVNGAAEIVIVTAHSSAATSLTATRAAEGSSAREHPQSTEWVHGPTAVDFLNVDLSTVAKGDILAGLSAGVLEIVAASGKSDGDVVTLQADGTVDFEAVPAGSTTLTALIDDIRDNQALLVLVDGPGLKDSNPDDTLIPIGMRVDIDGTGSFVAGSVRGGAFDLRTGATGDSQAMAVSIASAYGDRNARFIAILTSRATSAALKVQAWGFHVDRFVSNWTNTALHKAFFRSITTGALFAVTGNSSSEETTSLGGDHTLGNAGVFEVLTTNDGATWLFKIAGSTVATHSTTVPSASQALFTTLGIENNTTTDLRLTDIDLVAAVQDRS